MSPRERAARRLCRFNPTCAKVCEECAADVDAVLDEIPAVGDAALGNRLQGLSHFHDDQREALRDLIDAIKRGEG